MSGLKSTDLLATKAPNQLIHTNRARDRSPQVKPQRARSVIRAFGARSCPTPRTMIQDWPFQQPMNSLAITMRQVLEREEPILLVSHDDDDGVWQFIGTSDACVEDGRVVCLQDVFRLDPTISQVADLAPGWQAVRDGVGSEWTRRPRPDDLDSRSG